MPRSSEGGMEEDEEGDGDVAGADALRGDLRVNAAARVRVEKSYKRQKDSVDAVRNVSLFWTILFLPLAYLLTHIYVFNIVYFWLIILGPQNY